MKIIFINNLRLPTEKAYGQSIASMAKALTQEGAVVEIIANKSAKGVDFFDFYQLPRCAKFTALASTKLLPAHWGRLADYVNRVLFLLAIVVQKFPQEAFFITRQPEIAWLLGQLGFKVVFDAHRFPERGGKLLIKLLKQVKFVSANSYGTAKAFEEAGFYRLKVLPNGVDLSRFNNLPTSHNQQFTVLYLGHLYNWKGVHDILGAAESCPEILFKIAGGPEKDKLTLVKLAKQKGLNNVTFLGVVKNAEVPGVLSSADALVYSANPDSIEARLYTSPIKLFEYLASGRPVVAADLPSIREVISEEQGWFYEPGNPGSLARVLKQVNISQTETSSKIEAGQELVKKYSWTNRAKQLLDEIKIVKPKYLALGAFLADYPRNQLLLRSLASVTDLTVKNFYRSFWPGFMIWWSLISWSNTRVLLVQPAAYFSPALGLAKLWRREVVIADAFTSLYDTLVGDRLLVKSNSWKAKYYWWLDKLLIKNADACIFDTSDHQQYFEQTFNQGQKLAGAVLPVLVDSDLFARAKPATSLKGDYKILFYGKYIPLQGIETIIEAAHQLKGDNAIHFNLVGSGQTFNQMKTRALTLKLDNLTFWPKVDYLPLISLIKQADVCLGIFGQSAKAMRVVPNKVVESLAAGRPVITAGSPAIKAVFKSGEELLTIPVADPKALAAAILQLKNEPNLAKSLAESGQKAVTESHGLETGKEVLLKLISQL